MSLLSHCWISPLTDGRGGEMGTGPGVHNAYNWDSAKPGCGAYKESNIYREQSGPSMPRQVAAPRSNWPLLYMHYPAHYMHYMHHWPHMTPVAPKRKRSAPKRKSPVKRKPTKKPVKKTSVKRKKPAATRKSRAKK